MKKLVALTGIVSLAILLCSCPYESVVPIDEPRVKINPKILGTWEETEDHDVYKVSRKDDFTYSIDVTENKDNKANHFIAFLSTVNGATFLNLSEIKPADSGKKYALYKIEMPGDDMVKIFAVSDNIREQFTSSQDLKKFIATNMKNSYFLEREVSFHRIEKK